MQTADRRRVDTVLWAVIAGIGIGSLTLLGQAVLGSGWQRLANSGAVWSLVAFAVGTRTRSDREAALAGVATLLLAVAGYYASAVLFADAGARGSSLVIWGATACAAGPVFGIAGRWWREAPLPRRKIVAIAVLGAVFVAEGIWSLWRIPGDEPAATVEIVAGLLLPILLGRTGRERVRALATLVPASALILVVMSVVDLSFR